jgi:hypothetical protein
MTACTVNPSHNLIHCNTLDVGDKQATNHGLEFTLGEKVPYSSMPTLRPHDNGELFKPQHTEGRTTGEGAPC